MDARKVAIRILTKSVQQFLFWHFARARSLYFSIFRICLSFILYTPKGHKSAYGPSYATIFGVFLTVS